ncbi:MAG: Lrp/AsnC family transcriptional regulator [Clostridia bacterium]|nr:Lrp/AsnC family transcriptional regulator [Clostridia bacterium]
MKERILKYLEEDARLSHADIATMLGITEKEVDDAVAEYEADGTIKCYRTVVDWTKIGDRSVTALIELKTIPVRDRGFDAIAERIANFPEVQSVNLMSGGFDLAITVKGNDMRDVALFVSEKLATIEGVTSTATHFVLEKYKENGVIYASENVDKRGNTW